ncbi:RNA-binding protein [Bacillus sp. AR18-7]|uniref:RNA-binding protein n=1 Tax=Bacillus sp. AR18-7 TaxID=2217821 RepID=UPI0011C8F1FF|nr:RNA-binding protein [Bacillus sp. AR18-7]TXR64574.1 RNA-binding protein [Bacillus sp. AR18-7]
MQEMSQHVYEQLAAARRNKEFVKAMVQSIQKGTVPVINKENGKYEQKEIEYAVFALEGGARGICPAEHFAEYEYKSLASFTGSIQEFLVMDIVQEDNIAHVSVKEADIIKSEKFLREIYEAEENGQLKEKTYEGIVTGRNDKTNTIFLKVEGTQCFMKHDDLDHERVFDIESIAGRNQKVPLKVVRFNEETQQIQVSRKAAIEDPFLELAKYTPGESTVVGSVSEVHPRHGIFVQLQKGCTIKASKPREVEEPIVGDIVSVRLVEIDLEKRSARGVIFGYPQGKKKLNDITSFMFV